jgi:hypothetical protein
MSEFRYLPTLAELIDRLCIVQMKAIFIPKNREAYDREIEAIVHDTDIYLADVALSAKAVRAIIVNVLTNREIWLSESKAREGSPDQNDRLRFTHSLNGIRNQAKNVIACEMNQRVDLKVDCLAADPPGEYGDWDVFCSPRPQLHDDSCSTQGFE